MVRSIWFLLVIPALVSCFIPYRRPFVMPPCRLQAGYPTGMRVWIPDVPGMELFSFRGQINSPLTGQETGGLVGNVRAPVGGNWLFRVDGLVLNPGDILYFGTFVICDKKSYSKPNQTWTVPTREKFVDLNSPLPPPEPTTSPTTNATTTPMSIEFRTPLVTTTPKQKSTNEATTTTPQKITTPSTAETMADTTLMSESTTLPDMSTTKPTEGMTESTESITTPTETTPKSTEPTTKPTETTTKPTDPTTKPTETTTKPTDPTTKPTETTTKKTDPTTKPTETTTKPTDPTTETTTKPTDPTTKPTETTTTEPKTPPPEKRSTTEPPKLDDRMSPIDLLPPKNDTESTTPSLDKPVSEFSEEPMFGPFPPLFPGPYTPMMPSQGPGFEICSNPWNFMGKPGETQTQKLERQVAKLQCELGMFQRKFSQLNNIVENELTDIKKLNYDMVNRMARLESFLRARSPF